MAHTFNIGTGELAVILLVGILIFGPDKLPEVARRVGRTMRTFRKLGNSFRDEMRDAMAEPAKPASGGGRGTEPDGDRGPALHADRDPAPHADRDPAPDSHSASG